MSLSAPAVRSHRLTKMLPGVLVLALLTAAGDDSKQGCSCKRDPIVDPDDDTEIAVAAVETRLQIASADPSRVPVGLPTSVTLYGSGFEDGAVVSVGTAAASGVRVQGDSALTFLTPSLAAGTYDVSVRSPGGDAATLRRALTAQEAVTRCGSLTVQFDYNRETLTRAAQRAIDENLPCYTGRTDPIRLEGHADERGTTDYNLALGQRRAGSVARYLTGHGVPSGRLSTVSFGEERPANAAHNEAAWTQNRRAVIHVSR